MIAISRFLTIVGALLIVSALVAHIVCFATSNLAMVDFNLFMSKLNHTVQKMIDDGVIEDSDDMHLGASTSPAMLGEGANLHFGIWSLCMKISIMTTKPIEACFSWGSAFPQTGSMEKPDWMEAVKGCYIAGLVLAGLGVILTNTNVHTPSQGDRRRILPIFICVISFLTGVVLIVGNLIVAVNYDDALYLPGFDKLPPKLMKPFMNTMGDSMSLSWGFAIDVIAALLFILAGLFHVLAGRAAQREDKIRRQDEMETPLPNYEVAPL